jgi:hypothetical protein
MNLVLGVTLHKQIQSFNDLGTVFRTASLWELFVSFFVISWDITALTVDLTVVFKLCSLQLCCAFPLLKAGVLFNVSRKNRKANDSKEALLHGRAVTYVHSDFTFGSFSL